MIKSLFLILVVSISLFGVEIIIDQGMSLSDKRFIDKLLGKEAHSVEMHLNTPQKEVPSVSYKGNLSQGKKLFKTCAGCHGQKADKSALGKSKIIVNMSVPMIYKSLIGYKNRTYGGPLRGLMIGQVGPHNNQDLKNLAVYIGSLR